MNIALIGYGKMGKTIEGLALARNHSISHKIDENNQHDIQHLKADVAIEFTHPEAAFENIKTCLQQKIPVVCGTTGWLHHLPEIEKLCHEVNGTFFYASNFSIGVNLFFKLNKQLATLMSNFSQYQVALSETHHIHKKDAPSGTAITLAEGIIQQHQHYHAYQLDKSNQEGVISIEAIREGEVPGTHVVTYKSEVDEISIRHEAYSRQGFAAGALAIAEWIVKENKKGMLNMDDYLKF